jgi:ribonuclease HII
MAKKILIVGVDEAGRGPLAGPLAVGAAVLFVPAKKISFWSQVKDSKKISPKGREILFKEITKAKKQGLLQYRVNMVSPHIIDERGLSYAVRLGVRRAITGLGLSKDFLVLLDGSLFAPKKYKQKTIIRGDDIYKIIGLASIVAKVKRDRKMKSLAKKYPGYGFEIHAGYGTKSHYQALRVKGPSVIHRQLFLRSLTGDRK